MTAAKRAAKPRREVRAENMVPPYSFLRKFADQNRYRSGQSKTKDIASRGDGHVLFALDRIRHGRSRNRLSRVEVPQCLAGLRVHRFKRLRIVSKKKPAHPPSSSHRPTIALHPLAHSAKLAFRFPV